MGYKTNLATAEARIIATATFTFEEKNNGKQLERFIETSEAYMDVENGKTAMNEQYGIQTSFF